MIVSIQKYFSLIKISHTIFSLPFAVVGFVLAFYSKGLAFRYDTFVYVLLSVLFARSAAMGFNRYVDRKLDAKNPRTKTREIPSGKISPNTVLLLVILSSIAFVFTTYFINMLCFYLSPIALSVVLMYSFTKRFTYLSHFILGLGLALAPMGAYLSMNPTFDISIILLSVAVMFWVAAFDVVYALQDIQIDKKEGLFSIPSVFGFKNARIISIIMHLISVFLFSCFALKINVGGIYWIGLFLFSFFVALQHLRIKKQDLNNINIFFFTYNGIASIVFSTLIILDIFVKIDIFLLN